MPVRLADRGFSDHLIDNEFPWLKSQSFFSRARSSYTPDLFELNQRRYHLIFIPKKIGETLGGSGQLFRDPRVKYLGGAITVGQNFQVMTNSSGLRFESYVVSDSECVRDANINKRARVEGFAAAVPVSVICELDLTNNRGYQTDRQRRHIWLTAFKNKSSGGYHAVPSFIWSFKRDYLDRIGCSIPSTKTHIYSGSLKAVQGEKVFV